MNSVRQFRNITFAATCTLTSQKLAQYVCSVKALLVWALILTHNPLGYITLYPKKKFDEACSYSFFRCISFEYKVVNSGAPGWLSWLNV